MPIKTDIQRNKLMHLENTLVMYRVYNVEALERLVKTVHMLHSRQTMYESLFAGKTSRAYEYYLQMHSKQGIQHYVINSVLYLKMIKDKYIEIYHEFLSQLCRNTKAVRILAKGYILILLITPLNCKKF